MIRILDLTHDSYLAAAAGPAARIRHLPIGATNEPWRDRTAAPPPRPVAAALGLLAARAGAYDWVVVPPVFVDHTYENPWWQRALKRLLRRAGAGGAPEALLRAALLAGRCGYAVVDVSDRRTTSPVAVRLIRPSRYFKRNLILDEEAREVGASPLPMPLPASLADPVGEPPLAAERPIDLFVAGDYKTEARRRLLGVAERLREGGRAVDILAERVGHGEFLERIGRAKVVGAAEGWGYHTWRMYEAAALGAVPLVSAPPPRMWSWFEDGANCLMLPDSPERGVELVAGLLDDPARLAAVAAAARSAALRHNHPRRIAERMIAELRDARTVGRSGVSGRRWRRAHARR